jgi:hypothetical protein
MAPPPVKRFFCLRLRCAFVFFLTAATAPATVFHLTPEGAGKKDGTGWADAAEQRTLGALVNDRMQPGDELLVGSGTYAHVPVVFSKGGAPGLPKVITGVDRGQGLPVLAGEWSSAAPDKGGTAIKLGTGVSHLTMTGLRLRGWVCGVSAETSAAARAHLIFQDVDMEQCRHGFFLADCDDLRLEGCALKRYTKHAFRFAQGCDRVTIRQCTADCSEGDAEWERKTELFPFGFIINNTGAPNTAFLLEDCLACNNMMPLQTTKYKNGDGFVVEENAVEVALVRCRALRNQDGGFDVKAKGTRFTDCVASGNGRGFRIWTTATLTNCFAGWGTTGLWCNGGPVTARRCTFHALTESAILTDDGAGEPVTLHEGLISACKEAQRHTARGKVMLTGTLETTAAEAQYPAPDPKWDGLGEAMNSRAHPDKGYRAPIPP